MAQSEEVEKVEVCAEPSEEVQSHGDAPQGARLWRLVGWAGRHCPVTQCVACWKVPLGSGDTAYWDKVRTALVMCWEVNLVCSQWVAPGGNEVEGHRWGREGENEGDDGQRGFRTREELGAFCSLDGRDANTYLLLPIRNEKGRG